MNRTNSKFCSKCKKRLLFDNFHTICPKGRKSALYSSCKECRSKESEELAIRVLNAYGGSCRLCGEINLCFLTIAHTLNDGVDHRKKCKAVGGSHFYRILIRRGFPKDEGLAVECFNCNCSGGGKYNMWRKRRQDALLESKK